LPITDPRMTRFIITLEQGVQFVFRAFEQMEGGEVFVPKIPSTTIMDLAKAIGPTCRTEVVGIRPGEKLHECMVPLDEARHTVEFEDYYVIEPVLNSFSRKSKLDQPGTVRCADGFSYSSDTNRQWLSVEQLRNMIKEHCSDSQDQGRPSLRIAG
ncbi:MAG: polysaccharide biosynthesis protein, partial [Thermoguttaceae bacterium]